MDRSDNKMKQYALGVLAHLLLLLAWYLFVRLGDAVQAGQPLFRLHAESAVELDLARRWCDADPGISIA